MYAQPTRHPIPPVSRIATRLPAAVYSGQQPRLVSPVQGRPVQATMITGVQGAPARLIAPVLQTNNNVARIPTVQVQTRPPTPQVSSITTTVQPGRPPTQTIQVFTDKFLPALAKIHYEIVYDATRAESKRLSSRAAYDGWGSKFVTTKCRTTDISKFQNCEY